MSIIFYATLVKYLNFYKLLIKKKSRKLKDHVKTKYK